MFVAHFSLFAVRRAIVTYLPYVLRTVLHITCVMWCLMSATPRVIPIDYFHRNNSKKIHIYRRIPQGLLCTYNNGLSLVYERSKCSREYISRKMQKEHRFHDRASIQACRYKWDDRACKAKWKSKDIPHDQSSMGDKPEIEWIRYHARRCILIDRNMPPCDIMSWRTSHIFRPRRNITHTNVYNARFLLSYLFVQALGWLATCVPRISLVKVYTGFAFPEPERLIPE